MSRRVSRQPAQRKIAFLVDGDKEKLWVEALARKVIARCRPESRPHLATLPFWGTPRAGIYSLVELLLAEDYRRFFILFNTRSTRRRRISFMAGEIQESLLRARLEEKVSLIPLVPSMERWVLADTEALERAVGKPLPEELLRGQGEPEEILRELFGDWGPKEHRRVARHLDPERIRARDASFEAFVRALQSALGARVPPLSEEWQPAVT